jgi:hypothetical protein
MNKISIPYPLLRQIVLSIESFCPDSHWKYETELGNIVIANSFSKDSKVIRIDFELNPENNIVKPELTWEEWEKEYPCKQVEELPKYFRYSCYSRQEAEHAIGKMEEGGLEVVQFENMFYVVYYD